LVRTEELQPFGFCLDIKQTILVGPLAMVLSRESMVLGCGPC